MLARNFFGACWCASAASLKCNHDILPPSLCAYLLSQEKHDADKERSILSYPAFTQFFFGKRCRAHKGARRIPFFKKAKA